MDKINQNWKLSDADKTSLRRKQLQKLYVAGGNAKVNGVVEQVKASLDEGLSAVFMPPYLLSKSLMVEVDVGSIVRLLQPAGMVEQCLICLTNMMGLVWAPNKYLLFDKPSASYG